MVKVHLRIPKSSLVDVCRPRYLTGRFEDRDVTKADSS